MMRQSEKFIIGALILLILMPCMAGCGREDAGAADAASLEDTLEKREEIETDTAENTGALEAGVSGSAGAQETVTEEESVPRQEEILIAVESKDGMIIEEDENVQIKTAYAYDYDADWNEEARRWQFQKDTGMLEIWDYLDEQILFEGTVTLNEDGGLVNQEYYDMLFLDYMYDYQVNDDDADSTVKGGPEYEDGEWDYIEYESREAFLEQFGLENIEPVYRYYDWNGNLHLELYKEETKGQFYGITYEDYYYNSKGEKRAADVYGFPIEHVYEAEWTGEDAYSKMTEFKADEQDYVKDYEEFIEYTPAGLPKNFKSQGLIRTEAGEGLETVMGIDYVYRDDNTLFYRSYGHSSNVFQTTYGSRGSYYDEKGRVVYERGYHTNGYLRDYYIYEDDGEIPAYHLNIHYCHGGTNPSLSRIVS